MIGVVRRSDAKVVAGRVIVERVAGDEMRGERQGGRDGKQEQKEHGEPDPGGSYGQL